jgi:hypothetical protein
MSGFLTRIFFLALAVFWVAEASAQVCPVPTLAHASVQAAVDDAACTEIALAAQDYVGSVDVSRSLLLRGASSATTVILGQVAVIGATTEVSLQDIKVDGGGCFTVSLDVSGGAQVTSGPDVVVANAEGGQCPIFIDGFELGVIAAWSATVE